MSAPERIWAWPWEVNPNMGQWEAGRSIVGEGAPYVPEAALTAAQAEIARLTAELDARRRNMRETFDAMCAMRNSINEYLPMPSLESDLLQGPENSIFCATVAEAVVSALTATRAEPDAAMAGRVKVKPLVWEETYFVCYSSGSFEFFTSEHEAAARADWLDRGYYAYDENDLGPYGERLRREKESWERETKQLHEACVLAVLQPDTERAEPVVLKLSIQRRVGMHGVAYDGPTDARAYTYRHQPANQAAWGIGRAASLSANSPAGDYIDRGLALLRCLEDQGFGVFALVADEPTAPAPQAPAPKTTEAVAAPFRFDAKIKWRGHDDAHLVFAASRSGEWVRAADHDILVADLQTLLARVLVMDLGSAEEAAEALGGFPQVIHLVETHHAAHPRPGHPTTSLDSDEVEF